MATAGKTNKLRVIKKLDFGIYLDGGELGEILMPTKWIAGIVEINDELEVFVYYDSEDRPIATTMKPKAHVGEISCLTVKEITDVGAFLDWGLQKDLLVPFREQKERMQQGRAYLVYVYLDVRTKRIAASAKIEKFLDIEKISFQEGDEVDLIIWGKTDLGFKAIINHKHQGMLYNNEIFQELEIGQVLKGYISHIRSDGKIDLRLQKTGYDLISQLADKILKTLQDNMGYIPVGDKSDAREIYKMLQMSKKNFKKALGALNKNRLIAIDDNSVRLL